MIAEGAIRRRRLGAVRPRLVVIVVVLALLGTGGWLWLRDSALVAINKVTVIGPSGPDTAQIRSALSSAARTMTTLDVRIDQLRLAVVPYPIVKDLQVSTQFPHGLKIRVIEQVPVGAVAFGRRTLAVAGDGTLLHDISASPSLPTIPVRVQPGGSRLSDPTALNAVAVLAAAPYQMLSRISQVTTVATHGTVAQLRNGPSIYFGDPTELGAKWTAAIAVLGDSGSAGASYIDVTDPQRPAAGAQGGGTGSGAAGAATTTSSAPAASVSGTTSGG